jgi:hypothetical protein
MAKKRRPNKISEKKLDAMFGAFCDHQSIRHVSNKCHVSPTTVRRYRKIHNWDARVDEIEKQVQAIQDETEVQRRDRHIKLARLMEDKAVAFLEANGITSCKVAVHALVAAVRMEREAMGQSGSLDKVILEVVERGPE